MNDRDRPDDGGLPPTRPRRRTWPVALAAGVAVSVGAAWSLRRSDRADDVAAFERVAATRARVIADAMEVHRALLATVPGFVGASEEVRADALGAYFERLHEIRPSHAFLGFAVPTEGNGLARFVEEQRARGRPEFEVRRFDAEQGYVAPAEGEGHAPLVAGAPSRTFASLLGWDLVAEPAIRDALQDAQDLGEPRAVPAPPMPPLGSGDALGPVSLLVHPVYGPGLPRGTVAERRAALRGFAVVGLDLAVLMAHARATLEPEGVDIGLFDVTSGSRPIFLGHTPSPLDAEAGRDGLRDHAVATRGLCHRVALEFAGRRLEVVTLPAPSFLASRRSAAPWAALGVGLLLSAALAHLVRAANTRDEHVRRAVAERTQALFVAVEGLSRENAERRRAEAGLAEQTERLEVTLRSIGDAVITADAAGRVGYMNPAAEAMTGWTAVAAKERHLHEVLRFVDERSRAPRHDIVEEMLVAEAATETAIPVLLVEVGGQDRVVWPRWAPIVDPDGRSRGAVVALRDVTEARRAEQAVREREELFRMLSAELPDGLFLLDATDPRVPLRIVHANAAAARMHGLSPDALLSFSILDLDDEETAAAAPERIRRLQAGETVTFEARHRRADGTRFDVEVIAREITWGGRRLVLALDRDITERRRLEDERRRLEAQVQHAQRLESLGVLAGGIAHDFNNLLMGVLGNADLALLQLDPKTPAAARVEDLKRAALRASDLTQQLLAYAGRGRFVVEPLDLNDLVRDMAKLLEVSVSKRVRLVLDFATDLPPVEADAAQLRQVVMNLITNGAEAVGDQEGVVTLRTAVRPLDRAWLAGAYGGEGLPAGAYVVVEVTDTGVGMDEATQRKIFEPFFTTKFTGRGLGLSALLGIVKGHRGAVAVRSAPGRGTTFTVALPVYAGVVPVRRAAAPSARENGRRSGTVLVVDDDPSVLEVVGRILSGVGYEVVLAADGREAIERFREAKDRVRAVLLDLTMPGLSSEETLRRIREQRPDVEALVFSGFSEGDALDRFAGLRVAGFVQKPFERETLLARVASVVP